MRRAMKTAEKITCVLVRAETQFILEGWDAGRR